MASQFLVWIFISYQTWESEKLNELYYELSRDMGCLIILYFFYHLSVVLNPKKLLNQLVGYPIFWYEYIFNLELCAVFGASGPEGIDTTSICYVSTVTKQLWMETNRYIHVLCMASIRWNELYWAIYMDLVWNN